jgi:hypothetical protein
LYDFVQHRLSVWMEVKEIMETNERKSAIARCSP